MGPWSTRGLTGCGKIQNLFPRAKALLNPRTLCRSSSSEPLKTGVFPQPAKGQEGGPVASPSTMAWSGLRRAVLALFSVHLAIGVGMVASARFAWLYSHAYKDAPSPALALFLCELPLIFCLLPLITDEGSRRNVKSAGMAFGTALSFCPLPLPIEFDAQFRDWGRGGPLAQLARFLPVCFIIAVWMAGVSWRYGKGDRREFIASAKKGILGFLFVSLLVVLASL